MYWKKTKEDIKVPFSGVYQSFTIHMKYRVASGHREVNIRYTIRIKQATPGGGGSGFPHGVHVTGSQEKSLMSSCRIAA